MVREAGWLVTAVTGANYTTSAVITAVVVATVLGAVRFSAFLHAGVTADSK
jgi:hypothetical protein